MSIFGAANTPVLDFWSCLFWILKQDLAAIFVLGGGVHDIHSLTLTLGATPLPVSMVSIVASSFPHMF